MGERLRWRRRRKVLLLLLVVEERGECRLETGGVEGEAGSRGHGRVIQRRVHQRAEKAAVRLLFAFSCM